MVLLYRIRTEVLARVGYDRSASVLVDLTLISPALVY